MSGKPRKEHWRHTGHGKRPKKNTYNYSPRGREDEKWGRHNI